MTLPVKNLLLGIVVISIFSAVTSCKPKSNLQDDAIVEVKLDNVPVKSLRLLIPSGCVGSSWLYRRRVSPGMLQSLSRVQLNGPAHSSQINTDLMIAMTHRFGNNYGEVKRLLDSDVNVNETNSAGCTALMWAIVFKRRDVLPLLLEEGADIEQSDTKGRTPLMFAALAKDIDILSKLIDAGADVNIAQTGGENEIGTTALHHALTRKDNLETIKLLIEHGANVTAANETGRTPLLKAAGWGNVEYIQLLLDSGADLEHRSNIGKTALHESVSIGRRDGSAQMVRTLISKGANFKTRDKWGRTALMDAARWGNLEVVQLLVDAGADIEEKSNEGLTALDYARSKKKSLVIVYLESLK